MSKKKTKHIKVHNPSITEVERAIRGLVFHMDTKEVLTEEMINQLTESLTNFVAHATDKWIRGQEEHGGKITDRDLKVERANEIIDLWFYNDCDE